MKIETAERIIRKLRSTYWNYSDVDQERVTKLIIKLKSKIDYQPVNRDYHWMYACE